MKGWAPAPTAPAKSSAETDSTISAAKVVPQIFHSHRAFFSPLLPPSLQSLFCRYGGVIPTSYQLTVEKVAPPNVFLFAGRYDADELAFITRIEQLEYVPTRYDWIEASVLAGVALPLPPYHLQPPAPPARQLAPSSPRKRPASHIALLSHLPSSPSSPVKFHQTPRKPIRPLSDAPPPRVVVIPPTPTSHDNDSSEDESLTHYEGEEPSDEEIIECFRELEQIDEEEGESQDDFDDLTNSIGRDSHNADHLDSRMAEGESEIKQEEMDVPTDADDSGYFSAPNFSPLHSIPSNRPEPAIKAEEEDVKPTVTAKRVDIAAFLEHYRTLSNDGESRKDWNALELINGVDGFKVLKHGEEFAG